MSSRGRFHNGPWGPQQDWEHYDNRPPQPQWGGPYNDYGPPHDKGYDRGPFQRPPMNDIWRRGRGGNFGRGQSYSRGKPPSSNGPRMHYINDNPPGSGKPSWLYQPKNNTTVTTTTSSETKPAWLTQSTSATTSNSESSLGTQTQVSTVASDGKPSWLTQATAPSDGDGSNSKPAWLTETSSGSDSKPAWLCSSTDTTDQPQNSPTPKPAWLTKMSGIKPILKNPTTVLKPILKNSLQKATSQEVTSNDALPPPPPTHPPPLNQPKIELAQQQEQQQQQPPLTVTSPLITATMVSSRPKKKVKDDKDIQGMVALPGQKNFISYKNTLQEFCQKKGVGVPAYKSFKNSYGYSANVSLYTGQTVASSGVQKDKKEAEQCSAYEALKSLGLLSPQIPFVNGNPSKPGAKRQMPSPQTVAKKLKGETPSIINGPNYKSQLNEFCQKFHLPVPTYETTNSGNGFVTKIIYNKKEYISSAPLPTKKDAELNAAQLVLSKVNQAPPPSAQIAGPVGYPNFVPAASNPMGSGTATTASDTPTQVNNTTIPIRSIQDLAGQNFTPVISYKNKLQEACQKTRSNLPVYKTTKEGHLHCCELFVHGQTFNATGCKTKKGAEQSAARVALEALGLL